MTHLGEPGVGIGAGTGRPFSREPAPATTYTAAAPSDYTKPVRLSTPAARYTEAARANRVEGSVTLRVRIDEAGNVSGISVVRGLPDGLTEQAIAAARASKFKPATRDGKPVAAWMVMEISFTIR
jgi:protein TonB